MISANKASTMQGLEQMMAYEYKMGLLEKTMWSRLEKEVLNPLYAFRVASIKKLASIHSNVESKYSRMMEYATKTRKQKVSAMEAWNVLCTERSQLAVKKKKKKKKKKKHFFF